mmetsp:Transcript_25601/g.82903  ORF Transcript_25601/g.82903 Transcript_25601/m.82903 type:complete len:225 (+) Transcript_25601:344-1018(+)
MRGVCGRRRSGRWPGGRHQRREDEEGRSRFASATVDFPPDRCHRHLEVWEDVFARHGGRIVESFHLVSSSALSTVDGDGLVEGIDDPAEVDAVVHVVRHFCCDVAAFYGRAAREELNDELRSCTVKCRLARHPNVEPTENVKPPFESYTSPSSVSTAQFATWRANSPFPALVGVFVGNITTSWRHSAQYSTVSASFARHNSSTSSCSRGCARLMRAPRPSGNSS